jgi:hypothetical protein
MVLTYCLNDFEMVPFLPIITGITLVFTFHIRCIFIIIIIIIIIIIFITYIFLLRKSNVLNILYACRSVTAVAYQLVYSFNSATKIATHWLTHRTVCYCFTSFIVLTILTDHLICLLNNKCDFFLSFYANVCECCK